MKRNFFIIKCLIVSLFVVINTGSSVDAKVQTTDRGIYYTYSVKKKQEKDANSLNLFLARYIKCLNNHDLKKLADFYAFDFKTEDGFDKDQMLELISKVWTISPDISYITEIKSVRINNKFASIEFFEDISGVTEQESSITQDKGELTGKYHGVLYLEKYGKGWKIITDKTLFEETVIKYGQAKNIDFELSVPEQVFAGEEYTASLKVDIPSVGLLLSSITSEEVTLPRKKTEEVFRQMHPRTKTIERVIKANKNYKNEMATAAISYCEASKGNYKVPDLNITGTAVIFKRVNVLAIK